MVRLFLLPDGMGNRKFTDPRIDKERTARIHASQTISVLDVIALIKYWTKRHTVATMRSYYLECLILDYYESNASGADINGELRSLFAFMYYWVHQQLADPM